MAPDPATHRLALPCKQLRAPPRYFLRPHVYLTRASRHWVILDVHRDKYLCADRRQFESLGPWIQGWNPASGPEASDVAVPTPEALALADRLRSLDILGEESDGAKDAHATAYAQPLDAVDLDGLPPLGRSWGTHAAAFFVSCVKASRQLRRQAFESIITSTTARKARATTTAANFDIDRARPLLRVFDRLRWFYPRPYLCLFDSLALLHFLAGFRLYPDWIFGVKADPFEAHCWLQADGLVLNDTLGRVSGFTPIMHV